jgi:hypothetical protein
VSTTIFFSGLHHAAYLLACPPASYAHCWVCTWSALLACWLGFGQVGLEPSVLTHWVTVTNFLGLRLIPRSRAYLGAITTKFSGIWKFSYSQHSSTRRRQAPRAGAPPLSPGVSLPWGTTGAGCSVDALIERTFFLRGPCRNRQKSPIYATGWIPLPQAPLACRTTHFKNLCPLGPSVAGFATPRYGCGSLHLWHTLLGHLPHRDQDTSPPVDRDHGDSPWES